MVDMSPHKARKLAQDAGDVFGDVIIVMQALFVKVSRKQHEYIKANNLEIPAFGGLPVYYVIMEDD